MGCPHGWPYRKWWTSWPVGLGRAGGAGSGHGVPRHCASCLRHGQPPAANRGCAVPPYGGPRRSRGTALQAAKGVAHEMRLGSEAAKTTLRAPRMKCAIGSRVSGHRVWRPGALQAPLRRHCQDPEGDGPELKSQYYIE